MSSFGFIIEADQYQYMQEQTDNSTNMNSTNPGAMSRPRIQSANRSNMSMGMAFYKEHSYSGMMTNKGPSQPDLQIHTDDPRHLGPMNNRPTKSAANKYRQGLHEQPIVEEDYVMTMQRQGRGGALN